ncbi:MAG TPA: hypothetical protein EYO33_12145 [Phycisphaerales bacterium]|nr:hypothetical protein [Phycisphaerales bacterium]
MSSSSFDEEELRRKLLMMQSHPTLTYSAPVDIVERLTVVIPVVKSPRIAAGGKAITKGTSKKMAKHDWGPFGQYEYLGPGTPYKAKQKAGVVPVNQLDKI